MKQRSSQDYANNLAVQLRKGYLAFCVLKICSSPHYTSEIIAALKDAELVVVEGTIYPLLARLLRDGLLVHDGVRAHKDHHVNTITALNMGMKLLHYYLIILPL